MSSKYMPLSQAHAAYRKQLVQQEERSARIRMLMRKDFMYRMVFAGYVWGSLSYWQATKVHCLMYPYCPMFVVVATVVSEQLEEEMKQHARCGPQQRRQLHLAAVLSKREPQHVPVKKAAAGR